MGLTQNKGLIFSDVPSGFPTAGKDLTIGTREIDLSLTLPTSSVLVKICYVSLDPYMRGRMIAPGTKSWTTPFALGEPITSLAIAQVVKSSDPNYKEGDLVTSFLPVEEYTIVPSKEVEHLKNPHNLDPKEFMGALGMPGQTAYSSFYEIGKPKKGETIFVSAASGAVGQIVGQLAKREGLRVLGSVGSKEKLDFIINELGFDDGFVYKTEKPADALERLTAGGGLDIYYDNVGGETLDAALGVMNDKGRIGKAILI
jgi:NADPH-dependent curcumin reductase CurA